MTIWQEKRSLNLGLLRPHRNTSAADLLPFCSILIEVQLNRFLSRRTCVLDFRHFIFKFVNNRATNPVVDINHCIMRIIPLGGTAMAGYMNDRGWGEGGGQLCIYLSAALFFLQNCLILLLLPLAVCLCVTHMHSSGNPGLLRCKQKHG